MGSSSKSYRIEAVSRKDHPVQVPGVDLVALDVEILFIQPETRGMGEQHEQIHELFLC